MTALFHTSFCAVLQLVLVAFIGVALAYKGFFNADARKCIAKTIMLAMLPALLISSLSHDANPAALRQYCGVLLAAPVLVLCGFLVGKLLAFILRTPQQLRRCATAACMFGNTSYIPLPFLGAICATTIFPSLTQMEASERSVTYVSLYLLCYSPILWGVGFPYLSGKNFRELSWKQFVNPPLISAVIGISIAFFTPLYDLFYGKDAILGVIMDTCKLLAKGVFPCALLLLGANLLSNRQTATAKNTADSPDNNLPDPAAIPLRAYFHVILGKLLLMPLCGLAYVTLTWEIGFIPHDPMVALVILIESAVPPANNLIIMSQTHGHGETQMARLLFSAYCVSIITLTLWTMFFLHRVYNLR